MKLVLKTITLASLVFTGAMSASIAHAESLFPNGFFNLQPPTTQPSSPAAIDFAQVNSVLKTTLTDVIQGDDLITDLSIKFDPKSDVDQAKVGLTLTAGTNNSAWAPNQPVKLSAGLKTSKQTEVNDMVVLGMQGNLRATTDSLALVRWLAKKALSYMSTNPSGDLEKGTYDVMLALTQAKTLDDVFTGVTNLKAVFMKYGSDEEQQQAAPLVISKKGSTELLLSYAFGNNDAGLKKISVDIKGTSLNLIIDGTQTMNSVDLSDSIDQLKQVLVGIQQKNNDILDAVRELGREFVSFAKSVVLELN